MFVCMHVYMYVHVYVCGGRWSLPSVPLSHFSILFFEIRSPTDLGAYHLSRLPVNMKDLLAFISQCWNYKHSTMPGPFTWILGMEHESSCLLHGWSFTKWTVSPAHINFFEIPKFLDMELYFTSRVIEISFCPLKNTLKNISSHWDINLEGL